MPEGSALLPSALADEKPLLDDDECGKPIFDIFGAELSEGGKDMVRALKGHLEEVLKVQEEVGRMHLALEGLGDYAAQAEEKHTSESEARQSNGDEVVAKREKGIEEIMDRVGRADRVPYGTDVLTIVARSSLRSTSDVSLHRHSQTVLPSTGEPSAKAQSANNVHRPCRTLLLPLPHLTHFARSHPPPAPPSHGSRKAIIRSQAITTPQFAYPRIGTAPRSAQITQ